MGNSLGVVLDNYTGSAPIPCHLPLGASTSIDLFRNLREKDDAGVVSETWCVSYTVDKETCDVSLIRHGVDQHGNVEKVEFVVNDWLCGIIHGKFCMVITETNYIRIDPCEWVSLDEFLWTKAKRSYDARGGVMDTTVHLYGSESKRGLLAVESKKNTVVTVAHYFVKTSGTSFCRSTGTNIALSVVAKFGVSNGKFEIRVEGPDEVRRTGIWKPTMCPHCDHKRRGKLFWQSESEDSDSVSIPVPTRATPRNARGVSNGGRFRGNGNGNIYENNIMVFKRR